MEIISSFIKEIEDLNNFKKLYESQKKDKERMSEEIYDLMMYKFDTLTYEDRVSEYKKEFCRCCRYNWCNMDIPSDILKPIKSDKGWIPARKFCGAFEWS